MTQQDIRWQQRFGNYQKALDQLTKFMQRTTLNELEEQGLIQAFEYTHELAWKTLSDFIKSKGNTEIFGSKDVTREAFSLNLINNGEVWMEMIKSRNMSSDTYNEATTQKIIKAIRSDYYPAFIALEKRLTGLA
ncbi:MAG: nucleotidyltransferase substrate binding protein [Methylococcales bacterium]|nr:nucleotidyltransferase substrate binding protein [Methylococcales bacterium]